MVTMVIGSNQIYCFDFIYFICCICCSCWNPERFVCSIYPSSSCMWHPRIQVVVFFPFTPNLLLPLKSSKSLWNPRNRWSTRAAGRRAHLGWKSQNLRPAKPVGDGKIRSLKHQTWWFKHVLTIKHGELMGHKWKKCELGYKWKMVS